MRSAGGVKTWILLIINYIAGITRTHAVLEKLDAGGLAHR